MGCCYPKQVGPEPKAEIINAHNLNSLQNQKVQRLNLSLKIDKLKTIIKEIEKEENEEIKIWRKTVQNLLSTERLNKYIYAKKSWDFISVEELALYFKN